MPAAPPVPEAPPVPRPKSVDTAFSLWMANAGLNVLGFVVSIIFGRDAMRAAARTSLEQSHQSLAAENIDKVVSAALILSGVFTVIFFGLYLLFAFKMRAGRNWARITLTVLGGIGIVMSLVSLRGGGAGIVVVLTIVQVLLIGGAIVFMFVRDSAGYFTASNRPR